MKGFEHFCDIRESSRKNSLIKNSTHCTGEEVDSKYAELASRRTKINGSQAAFVTAAILAVVTVGVLAGASGADCSTSADSSFDSAVNKIPNSGTVSCSNSQKQTFAETVNDLSKAISEGKPGTSLNPRGILSFGKNVRTI